MSEYTQQEFSQEVLAILQNRRLSTGEKLNLIRSIHNNSDYRFFITLPLMIDREILFQSKPYLYAYRTTMKKYFGKHGFSEPKYENLRLTYEGEYSITKPSEQQYLLKLLENIPKTMIVDATAGCGGDTLLFAEHFDTVYAFEANPDNYYCLVENIQAFGMDNVKTFGKYDYKTFNEYSLQPAEVVYYDPPWGGKGYSNDTVTMDDEPFSDYLKTIDNNYIIVKVPSRYHLPTLTGYEKITQQTGKMLFGLYIKK